MKAGETIHTGTATNTARAMRRYCAQVAGCANG